MIHIEGMGVLGCQVAWELDKQGLGFTWSDIDAPWTAWHCSTGMVYPSGSERDMAGLGWWVNEITNQGEHRDYAAVLPYAFAHKNPPHGGKYEAFQVPGSHLQLASEPSVAVNVPDMVRVTREQRYPHRRTGGARPGDLVIQAYADPEKLDGYLWGWAARVRFDGPAHTDDRQATYYAKKHRFNLTYAYPIPGTGQWWAGSTLLHQGKPSEREAQRYLDEWLANAPTLLGISNIQVDSLEQGWRPRRKADTPNEAREVSPGVWALAPEPTSGVRHGPLIVADLMQRIGL